MDTSEEETCFILRKISPGVHNFEDNHLPEVVPQPREDASTASLPSLPTHHHSGSAVLYSTHPFGNKAAKFANLFHRVRYPPRETVSAPGTAADS